MRFESDIECKRFEKFVAQVQKCHMRDMTPMEALEFIKTFEEIIKAVRAHKIPAPIGTVCEEVGKKVTPIKAGRKKAKK